MLLRCSSSADHSPRRPSALLALLAAAALTAVCIAHPRPDRGSSPNRSGDSTGGEAPVVRASIGDRVRASPEQGPTRFPDVLLQGLGAAAVPLDLDLAPAGVVTPRTTFVLGDRAGDRPLAYDRSRVRALRGSVAGESGSHAFVVVGPQGTAGYVERAGLPAGAANRLWIREEPASNDARFSAVAAVAPPPHLPRCGVLDEPCGSRHTSCGHTQGAALRVHDALPVDGSGQDGPPQGGLAAGDSSAALPRVVELAIETDHELFSLFGEAQATADHVAMVFAAVSDILERDAGVRVELVFVRIWDTPDDLFDEPDPLQPFRNYWNANMGFVQRDAAQFLSGRRDLPWGGIAYLSALCGPFAYSVVGYAVGRIPDLDAPSVYHFDVPVCAHELGHNLGSNHTHAYGLDDCNLLNNTPQRGTIMSYCSQTVSGGNAMTDLRFDTVTAGVMRQYAAIAPCLHVDCDGDGVDDAAQIAADPALDADANGVLDACEDCDGDGVSNAQEIAGGAADLDGNGIPDECEPDCNGNGVPDAQDIAEGTSTDLWLNGVPDECETDCDGDGQSDYAQIQAKPSLDLDRDLRLDACQDCDGDGVIDLAARDGAWDAWVTTHHHDTRVLAMHAIAGTTVQVSEPGAAEGNDLVITADRRVLVSSQATDSVVEFAADGALVGALVPPGLGGLSDPTGLLIHGDSLLVASRGTSAVLRYDLADGAFLGAFVPSGSGGLISPFGLCLGPDGHVYVNGADNRVRRYHGQSGAPLGVFVAAQSNGGLSDPRGMLFLPDGRLLVAGRLNDAILSYDGGSGAFLGSFNKGGTTAALTFDEPWGLRLGPNGNLFAVRHHPGEPTGEGGGLLHGDLAELHVNASRIYEFDVQSGVFIRSYVTGHDTGLWAPTGFDFMPGEATDCNRNGVADGCDIIRGASPDLNGNGVPDECESFSPDLDGDGLVDGADLGILLAAWGPCPQPTDCLEDQNGDGLVDGADLGVLLAAWTE
jgi:hypothetical protein